MKNILIIYFSQTGQSKVALDSLLKPFSNNEKYKLHFQLIKPKNPFSYPWKYSEFMDAFPENVHGVPCELEPLNIDKSISYDLIFIGYQPWFLSVCRPINSFLLSNDASVLLSGKPVITVINCRNMWLGAQEKMKKRLKELNANLVGNIIFPDHTSNLTSLVTVLAFELKGIKEKYLGFFPKYGINDSDLKKAPDAGKLIENALNSNDFSKIQSDFVKMNMVQIKANLMIMEGRGRALFPLYANYITKKGGEGSKGRKTRVKIFGILLPTVIFLVSPIITLIARLTPLLAASKIKKQIAYYQQNSLESRN